MNMSGAADVLRKAMKGFGTDEDALIRILAPMGPLEVESVKDAFKQNHKRDLMKDVHSETSGYFREGLEAILRGPLEQDCYTLREGLKGIGTKEEFLDEVLLGRSNADIRNGVGRPEDRRVRPHQPPTNRKQCQRDLQGY
jgi:annexin A7/11